MLSCSSEKKPKKGFFVGGCGFYEESSVVGLTFRWRKFKESAGRLWWRADKRRHARQGLIPEPSCSPLVTSIWPQTRNTTDSRVDCILHCLPMHACSCERMGLYTRRKRSCRQGRDCQAAEEEEEERQRWEREGGRRMMFFSSCSFGFVFLDWTARVSSPMCLVLPPSRNEGQQGYELCSVCGGLAFLSLAPMNLAEPSFLSVAPAASDQWQIFNLLID